MAKSATEHGTEKPYMEEIALAEGGNNKNLDPEMEKKQERFLNELDMAEGAAEERKLKSGSIRRFFRMNAKKTAETTKPAEDKTNSANELQTRPTDEVTNDEAGGSDTTNKEPYKRYKFHLGSMYRYPQANEGDTKIELNDAASKVTLKSSLSTYWNSVFKKKKSKSAHEVGGHHEPMVEMAQTNNLSETALRNPQRVNDLVEDVHDLKISDEPAGN